MANSRKKNRRRKTLSAVLIVLALLIAGAAVGVKLLRQRVTEAYGEKSKEEAQKATVTVGSISATITGSGTLSAQETTEVSVPSGVALRSLCVAEGDTVAKQTLCDVTPQEKMLITVPIDELDVLSLALGQQADLYLDALPAASFTAIVTEIDPEGENSGGNTKYSVTLAMDRQAQLYPGMNGTVSFPRAERQKVPTVPLAAVEEDGSRTVIYTAYDPETDQLLSPVEIQTGLSDGTDVELLAGLSLGDTYCYRYADSISYVTE